MFKTVIGRGHPEFSTNRQQDAQEFFMHLLSTIDRAEVHFRGIYPDCGFSSFASHRQLQRTYVLHLY